PRRLVIFRRDESLSAFVEIERAELASDLMLLVHGTLAHELREVLDVCARPGFVQRSPDELKGLPDEWRLFVGVQLVDMPPDDLRDDLRPLTPLSWTQVAFGGGLSLPGGGTWHSSRPPEVRATALGAAATVEATMLCLQTFGAEEPEEIALGSFQGSALFATDALGLRDGDYEVRLYTEGKRQFLARASFRLRSAEVRLPDLASTPLVGHLGDGSPWSTLSATIDDRSADRVWVRGAVTALPPLPTGGGALPPGDLATGGTSLEDDAAVAVLTKARSGEAAECLTRGAHHWLLEPQVPHKRLWRINAVCKRCGLARRFPGWAPLRKQFQRPKPVLVQVIPATPVQVARSAHSDLAVVIEGPPLDYDTFLDSLCYVGRGSWGAFAKLAEQVEDSPWFALEASRSLSALGHLDVVIDPKSVRPASWAVSPPSLVETTDGWVLAGFRSAALIERLGRAVSGVGGMLTSTSEQGSPSVLRLRGVAGGALDAVAHELADAGPEPMVVVRDASRRVLSACRGLDEVAESLPLVAMPTNVGMQIFDPREGTWASCQELRDPGAYRVMLRPVRYAFLSRDHAADRRVRLGDNRTVKFLAARELGVPMLAYDAGERSLWTRLGSQLPGLYERAVVLASGRAPRQLKDGTVVYPSVPEEIAAAVWSFVGR
ncbi:MAG: hypothetical protein M3P43_17510, partial [Actinomycetota bacterium]|nr:hypothetical protein [Actinomycetota bacterium]